MAGCSIIKPAFEMQSSKTQSKCNFFSVFLILSIVALLSSRAKLKPVPVTFCDFSTLPPLNLQLANHSYLTQYK